MLELIHEHETLVAALRERGVDYLTPTDARLSEPVDDEALIASLAAHPNARLRQALVSLFLLRPELSSMVTSLKDRLAPSVALELTAYYTAAMYLQRMWRIRLGHYLPSFPELPDYFSSELSLPSPDDEHGKVGLYALAGMAREPITFPVQSPGGVPKCQRTALSESQAEETHT